MAKTFNEIDGMDARERLRLALEDIYGQRADMIAKEYRNAYSQADRQTLSRGMQRSSFANQTLANIKDQEIDKLAENESEKAAKYAEGLMDIEQQEQAQANWEAEFALKNAAASGGGGGGGGYNPTKNNNQQNGIGDKDLEDILFGYNNNGNNGNQGNDFGYLRDEIARINNKMVNTVPQSPFSVVQNEIAATNDKISNVKKPIIAQKYKIK